MQDCGFKVQASKRATGRVVCWMDLAIPNSYTLEASFCGMGDNAIVDARWVCSCGHDCHQRLPHTPPTPYALCLFHVAHCLVCVLGDT